MNNFRPKDSHIIPQIFIIFFVPFLTIICDRKPADQLTSIREPNITEPEWTPEQNEIKETVERFLVVVGNFPTEEYNRQLQIGI